MPFALKHQMIDYFKIANPDLRAAFAKGLAMFYYQDLAAPGVGIHAAVQEGAANAFAGAITNPATPKNAQAVFAAGWQGGDIYLTGTDQFGRAQTETIADAAGTTVQGVKIWRTITAISKETVAGTTDTVTLQTGTKIGIPVPLKNAFGLELVAGVAELATWCATYHGFTPTTAPDGSRDFTILVPVDWATYQKILVLPLTEV